MRTLPNSLSRLAELLPMIGVEVRHENNTYWIDCLYNVYCPEMHGMSEWGDSWDNAGALERLSDLVYEKTGLMALTLPQRSVLGVSWAGTVDRIKEGGGLGLTPFFPRKDHSHIEALILAIEKYLEEQK